MKPGWVILGGVMLMLPCLAFALIYARREAKLGRHLAARLEGLRPVAAPLDAAQLATARQAWLVRRIPIAVRVRLARADIEVSGLHLLLPALGLVGVDALLLQSFPPLVALLVTIAALVAPMLLLQAIANRRLGRFVEALPSLLDQIKHLLLAGNSLQQALVRSIDATSEPVERYLQPVARRLRNGAPVPESIFWLADQLQSPELYIFAAGVQTSARYGGRMSAMLTNLAQIMRDGARVRRELSSATAETRLSAIVLSLLPVSVAAIIAVINPSYMLFFTETAQGHHMALFAIALQVIGMFVIHRVLQLDF